MAKTPQKSLIAGIDIGTSKVVTLIGEIDAQNKITILGVGLHPSQGMKRGVVINIEAAVHSIQCSVAEAEAMAGCQISSAYTGIAGTHISSINSHGIVAIRDTEVNQFDIDRVIDAAKAVALPAEQKILHILPQEFIIDGQNSIREPLGMSGVRLEAKVHIVTGAVSAAQNIVKCLKRCNLVTTDIILEQFASSQAILTEDEKELGVCMIDIGGGTTDLALFIDGAIRHTAVIPIAGEQVTNDIAIALRIPARYAEDIKIQHGHVYAQSANGNSLTFEHVTLGGDKGVSKPFSKQLLAEVVEARYEELFALVANEIRRCGLDDKLAAGVVLTGGAAKIPGASQLAERVFNMPVRLGTPQFLTGPVDVMSNPMYATAVGLLLFGLQQLHNNQRENVSQAGLKHLFARMQNWFKTNF